MTHTEEDSRVGDANDRGAERHVDRVLVVAACDTSSIACEVW
jgi:hypothetical protein